MPNKPKTFEDLLAGEVRLSLINEPPQPVEVEMLSARRLTAREIARRRWGIENEQEKARPARELR
jgi:hypothetical protein